MMGTAAPPSPVMLILAAFSKYPEAIDWAKRQAEASWGPVALESPPFQFDETSYYEPTMGTPLRKVFFAFEDLIDPGRLPDIKLQTNSWERQYAVLAPVPEVRPLNLDPGYLAMGKLVLASTKDFCHRIYIARGIYAEVTLIYRHGKWESHPWTFADYRRADYHEFFTQCRELLRKRLREVQHQ